ncbi:hypothetical protein QR46_1293 [Giardia duodenalis assemblage B]|uniref:Uncharacterized protein n=1 Tax=Giardia duodenalis assemblage B TaxID=1394984 RepID=A0A132NXB6_GIAIN|nr:hypothetical protein QR46_1293 [Giardia intestinalis assemblage B]
MVRAALPLALKCNTCEQTIARGKKLYMQKKGNKQDLIFMFKCPHCSTVLSFVASIADGCYLPGEGATQVGMVAREHAAEQPLLSALVTSFYSLLLHQKNLKLNEEHVMCEYVRQFTMLQRAASQGDSGELANLDVRYRALSFLDHS